MLERCPVPTPGAVAEVGCGTGKLLREVVRRLEPALAVGVEPDRTFLPHLADLEIRLGEAAALPLGDDAFDLVYCSLAFHLVAAKAAAAAELRRVLKPGGHVAIWTLTPEHVRGFHLNPYFPSLAGLDLLRFEPPESWMELLAAAGLEPVAEAELRTLRVTTAGRLARAVRARFISTLSLLPEAEFEAGARRLEAEAAGDPRRRVSHPQIWCMVWARRPPSD